MIQLVMFTYSRMLMCRGLHLRERRRAACVKLLPDIRNKQQNISTWRGRLLCVQHERGSGEEAKQWLFWMKLIDRIEKYHCQTTLVK